MDREEIEAIVAAYLAAELDQAEARIASGAWHAADVRDTGDLDPAGVLTERAEALKRASDFHDYAATMGLARELAPGIEGDALRVLAKRLLEAQQESVSAEIAALHGGKPFPRAAAPAPAGKPRRQGGPTVKAFLAQYIERRTSAGKWSPKSRKAVVGMLSVVADLLPDKPIGQITEADMQALWDDLNHWPTYWAQRPAFRGKTPRQVVDTVKAAAPGTHELLTPQSKNDYLTWTKTLFKYAVKAKIIEHSPCGDIEDHKEPDRRTRRDAFTPEQRAAFLRQTEGLRDSDPAAYWVPRIMFLSGMRLEEATKLRPADIHEREGVQCFDVNEEAGRNKRPTANRVIPVHPDLVRLGLLDRRDKVAGESGTEANMWGMQKGQDGYWSTQLSKRLRARGKAAGLPKKVVTESARNTFLRELRRVGCPLETVKELAGHSVEGDSDAVTLGYLGKAELEALAGYVAKVPAITEDPA